MTSSFAAVLDNPSPHPVMTALGRGVPLTLLCDLFEQPSALGLLESERENPWLERLAYEVQSSRRGVRLSG